MSQKIGAGHAEAWLRAGAKEAAQALVAFPAHAIQPVEEPGLVGNATQQEVNIEKGNAMPYQQWLTSHYGNVGQDHEQAEPGRER